MTESYCQRNLPSSVIEKLEAGAFRSLCRHLQERSDQVQNMELMTLSGFCRNCLAKWMVKEARAVVDQGLVGESNEVDALNMLGYPEAAEHVYGMKYDDWKKRHQKAPSDAQLHLFNKSKPLQAVHDKSLLATRETKKDLASDVCCQPTPPPPVPKKQSRNLPAYVPPPIDSSQLPSPLRLAILTVSDRASKNQYETGDLSGPAVEKAVMTMLTAVSTTIVVVPDEFSAIQNQIMTWCDQQQQHDAAPHLILTTGGTGLSPRDVTPEATRQLLTTELIGLMAFVTTECSRLQPLASLSRGTGGVVGSTIVANLPGNPAGVEQIVPILLPLLLHALQDVTN